MNRHDEAEKFVVGAKVVGYPVGAYVDRTFIFGKITKFSKGGKRFRVQLVKAICERRLENTYKCEYKMTPDWDVVLRGEIESVCYPSCYQNRAEVCWDIYDETEVYIGETP